MPLAKLLAVPRGATELQRPEFLEDYDAQSWGFVHFLMFGEQGKRAPQLNDFIQQVSGGKEPGVAFAGTLGPLEPFGSGAPELRPPKPVRLQSS